MIPLPLFNKKSKKSLADFALEMKQKRDAEDAAKLANEKAMIQSEMEKQGQEMESLAKRYLGDQTQFAQSERAQEKLARRQATAESQGAQRALAGQLARQGVRGGAAAAAQLGALQQGAALQSQIGQQMIAGRAEREQALKQNLLSAVLSGRQLGNATIQQLLANQTNIQAARLAKK